MELQWIEVKITTQTEAVEAISYMLTELGIQGVRIDDPKDILMQKQDERDWDYADEDLLHSKDPNKVEIFCYLSQEDNYVERIEEIKSRLSMIASFLPIGEGTVTIQKREEKQWENAWKQYYKPFRAGEHIVIQPTWESATFTKKGDIVIELDPGMAFGTGTHETTSMCIQLLEQYMTTNDIILDIGCGSGILSIVAGKLGAQKVIGVDIDPNAVKVARENVQMNQINEKVEIRQGDLLDVVQEKAHCIVANIIADVIIQLVKPVPEVLEPKGIFIASGIIQDRLEEVKEAIEKGPFTILQVVSKGEWAAIVAQRRG